MKSLKDLLTFLSEMQVSVLEVEAEFVVDALEARLATIRGAHLDQHFRRPLHHQRIFTLGIWIALVGFCFSGYHQVPFAQRIERNFKDNFIIVAQLTYLLPSPISTNHEINIFRHLTQRYF